MGLLPIKYLMINVKKNLFKTLELKRLRCIIFIISIFDTCFNFLNIEKGIKPEKIIISVQNELLLC